MSLIYKTTPGILLILCVQALFAQSHWVTFDTSNSGLPNNQVEAISIDSNNVRWIGTSNGLARFDGVNWTVFDSANSPLPSSHVLSVEANGISGVWVGTYEGVGIYNGTTWQIHNTQNNSAFANNTIVQLLYDDINEVMWVATEYGVVKYDGAVWTLYNDSTSMFGDPVVRSIAVDNNGDLLAGTFDFFNFTGRLFRFDGTTWTNTRLDLQGLPGGRPDALAVDANNVIWMGVSGTGAGSSLVKITGTTWEPFADSISPVLGTGVGCIALEGHLKWFTNAQGLIVYNDTTFTGYSTANSGLPENSILSIAIDGDGNKWIGTLSGGVAVFTHDSTTSVDDVIGRSEIELSVTPNPFSTTTIIHLNVPDESVMTIYNSVGALVQTVSVNAGEPNCTFNAEQFESGIYFCKVTCGRKQVIKKLMLVK